MFFLIIQLLLIADRNVFFS